MWLVFVLYIAVAELCIKWKCIVKFKVICRGLGSVVSFCFVFGCFRIVYKMDDLIECGILLKVVLYLYLAVAVK